MTEITNKGNKIVHIGKKMLMPGDSITVDDKAAKNPSIMALAKHGALAVKTTETKKAAKKETAKKAEEPVAEEVTEVAEVAEVAEETKEPEVVEEAPKAKKSKKAE